MAPEEYYLEDIVNGRKTLILELENLILTESVDFYRELGLYWLSAPITTGTISSPMGLGSDSLPVKIALDKQETYLADSMQFILEYGCRFFKKGCWYIMPTFRGESIDKRHLKQFFHSEAEIPGNLNDIMHLVDSYVKRLVRKIQNLIGEKEHLINFLKQDIPRISFDDAEAILGKKYIKYARTWRNITNEGEKALIKHFGGPVWVMYYDEDAVPFYQYSKNGKASNADLLMGIGETVGCGERWSGHEEILAALSHHKINRDEYEWYIKMKKFFPLKTSGFGMGIERFLLFILGEEDIRNMQVFRRFNDGKDIV